MPSPQHKQPNNFLIILMLGLLETITPFSIDMYLPAFSRIAQDLHTPVENIALSVSSYFLGFAIGQIVYGPLLDRFGRKKPLYTGMFIYVAATIGCTTVHSIEIFLLMRFIQALGGCVSSVAAIAMVQDLFPPEKSASVISFLILVIGLSPMLAPSAGSLVLGILGWQGVFLTLAGIATLLIAATFFFLPAGAPPDKSISLRPKPILTIFWNILKEPQFYLYTLAGSFSFAGLFIYVAGSPTLFMDYFHLTAKQYGGVFALLSVGLIGGSQLNHLLTRRFSSKAIFSTMLTAHVITSILFAVAAIAGILSLPATLVFLFITLLCVGIEGPNATAISIAPFSKTAGSASSLLGFLRIGIGGLISSCVGWLPGSGCLPLAIGMAASAGIAILIFLGGKKRAFLQKPTLAVE